MARTSLSTYMHGSSPPTGPAARHDTIIDFILLNPGASRAQIGAHFGLTPQYITNITCSDAFQRALAERRAAIRDKVEVTVVERLRGLAHVAITSMTEQIERDPMVPIAEKRETCDMALRFLGYSSAAGAERQQPAVQVNIISKEDLELARERIRNKRAADIAEPVE